MARKLNLFIPIKKIDEEQRLVYGQVATEVLDNSGEVFDYEASKPYFEKWSENAYNTSGGKSYGNLRVMHTAKVAGRIDAPLHFDDDNKTIEAVAKVVDDEDWKKVLEGCYTGFSMGGRYVERVKKGSETRYVADPVEVSLVDKPCIPNATFEVVKADGVVEVRKFDDSVLMKGYNEDQERDENGRFASGGGGGDGGDMPEVAAGYEDSYTGYDEFADEDAEDGQTGAHVFEFADEERMYDFLGEVGGAPHPMGGNRVILKSASASTIKKTHGGQDIKVYTPTNDEILPVARELAKADGKEGPNDWVDYADAAREHLVAKAAEAEGEEAAKGDNPFAKEGEEGEEGDEEAKDKAKDGEDKSDDDGEEGEEEDEDAKAAEKSDTPELEQGWRAKDGTFFVKKADAVAHNEQLAKGDDAGEPSLADQLRSLSADVEAVAKGEVVEEDEPSEIEKMADAMEAIVKVDHGGKLAKSMYTVERTARLLRELASLNICVSREAKREGDQSTLPSEIGIAVGQMGDVLIAMAKEEVEELLTQVANDGQGADDTALASPYYDSYFELAAGTLGLEKSALIAQTTERLQKRAPAVDPDVMAKLDAANQRAEEAIAKADKLEAERTEITELVKGLQVQIEQIKKMPLGKAPTSSFTKADGGPGLDGPLTKEQLLAKFTPDELANAAIRMSQQNGRNITLPQGGQ